MKKTMADQTAFQIWEAGRVPNLAYAWAKAAWDDQQYVIDLLTIKGKKDDAISLLQDEVAYLRGRLKEQQR
jgi:hypothetical protein